MIKSFKYFDKELNGQKIYEAFDDTKDKNGDSFAEDVNVELLSDNKYLLKISRIVFKKLSASNLGKFGIYPLVINIDNVPGVYFYNHDNPSINIVICRNTHGKHVYLFREFKMSANNVADLVLSTKSLGFTDIINRMIDNLKGNVIEEGLICEWKENGEQKAYPYTDTLVADAANMEQTIRQNIVDIMDTLSLPKSPAKFSKIFDVIWDGHINGDQTCIAICDEIKEKFGKKGGELKENGYIKNVINIFASGYRGSYTYSAVESVFDGCTSKYTFGFFGGGADISTSKGSNSIIDDGLSEQRKKEYEMAIIEDTKEYNDTMNDIYNVANTMCKYVKQNCVLSADDWGIMRMRGMLITGKAGAGKSYSIKQALKANGMRPNKDYFNVSSGNTASKSLFKKLYDYNGKLLIFDDSAGLFDAEYKVSFWKFALEPDIRDAVVELSQAVGPDEKIGSNIYVPADLTRQERYYVEIGSSTPKEKADFEKNIRPQIEKKYLRKIQATDPNIQSVRDFKPSDHNIVDIMMKKEWKKHELTKKAKMPNRFNFKGVIIIISNKDEKTFMEEVKGKDNWEAITRRMRNFDLHPKSESMWNRIKEDILKQFNDKTLTDEDCLIPKIFTEVFIQEVENNMEKGYRNMNFSIISEDMNKILNSKTASENWKEELKKLMKLHKTSKK